MFLVEIVLEHLGRELDPVTPDGASGFRVELANVSCPSVRVSQNFIRLSGSRIRWPNATLCTMARMNFTLCSVHTNRVVSTKSARARAYLRSCSCDWLLSR